MDYFGRKKPAPDFIIRLSEAQIRPWKVPTRALSRALQAIQRLIDQREEDEDSMLASGGVYAAATPDEAGDKALRLIDIRSSSAAYAVAAPAHDFAINLISATGKGLHAPDTFNWTSPTLSALKDLSDVARSLHCTIELRRPGTGKNYGEVLAEISGRTFADIESTVFIKGETTVYARIERVGGATEMHCGIRLPEQPRKMVICHVAGADLVRQLGQFMYQHVLLSGTATWLRHSRQLKSLTVTTFEPPKTGSLRGAMSRIHDAGGSAWDRIKDPARKIAEIRGA